MKINRSTRLKIYKHAKDNYIKGILNHRGEVYGMCQELLNSLNYVTRKTFFMEELELLLPELKAIKPNKVRVIGYYWWPITDTKSRINAFNKIIEMVESEINKNFWRKLLNKFSFIKIW